MYEAADPPPAADSLVAIEASKFGGTVVYQICPGGSGGFVWVPKRAAKPAPPSAAELARDAYGELVLPAPLPVRYPAGTLADGRPYTIVNTRMWFSTDVSVWRAVSRTVCAGALCATARAVPKSLSLDPGDGGQAVSCGGPGTVWVRPAGGSWVPGRQPQGCDYRYTRSSFGLPHGEVTAAYSISWSVTWTGTNGTSGTLAALTTTAPSTFAVAELQTVVIR